MTLNLDRFFIMFALSAAALDRHRPLSPLKPPSTTQPAICRKPGTAGGPGGPGAGGGSAAGCAGGAAGAAAKSGPAM